MNKFIIEYESGNRSLSACVVTNQTITNIQEMIESGYYKMLCFELEDGKDNYILIKADKIVVIINC